MVSFTQSGKYKVVMFMEKVVLAKSYNDQEKIVTFLPLFIWIWDFP